MTLVAVHRIGEKLVVVTDGAGASGPKCGVFPHHLAIVAFWGYYDLCPSALCCPPDEVQPEQRGLAEANYIGNALPSPKEGKQKFAAVFESELNKAENVHNGDGSRGPAGLLLAFGTETGVETFVCDANSGKGSWQARAEVRDWPVFFGQAHEVVDMLKANGESLKEFIGTVTSVEDFAGKVKTLIARTSEHMVAKGLVRSIGLPAWLLVLSKDGLVGIPRQV